MLSPSSCGKDQDQSVRLRRPSPLTRLLPDLSARLPPSAPCSLPHPLGMMNIHFSGAGGQYSLL